MAAFNPDDTSRCWLLEDGEYIPFQLIESRFANGSLDRALEMKERQRELVRAEKESNLQARLDLINHIQNIAGRADAPLGT